MGKSSKATQQALEQLATIDLIELCNEAKIERCRATRDLSSCGRYVQHVLNSCGHASLCAECSQRCDVCPICRTSIPNDVSRIRLRLYYKCIEAGLISKRHDERFQETDVGGAHQMADIKRLYSLFDVALENNLVSLICHYVTDVCMDESAVSSDPVLAFLLDEVVVKDWCKQTFSSVISDLQGKYCLGVKEMKYKVPLLQSLEMRLSGISNVLEVMVSMFGEDFPRQLHDLHQLLENTLKAKQHLEVMIWCIQHEFLDNVQSRYPNYTSWNRQFHENKLAAVERAWPELLSCTADSSGSLGSTLFIEEALSNLGIDQVYAEERKEDTIFCLQDGNSSSFLRSKINETDKNEVVAYYPFENLRAAADVLFLHGTSDMVVAKRAIFLYYLFDRHWTGPDDEWRHLVDDFAASFSISRHSILECLTFYLLDDHSDQALQEAIHLLPEIAGPETHPKVAQVLLERQRPEVALSVLRCAGHDDFSVYPDSGHDSLVNSSLSEAITGVRVRIECGLLTESFMYQRMHCLKMKELTSKNNSSMRISSNTKSGSWLYCIEVLVTEICHLCIRRNLVDRMIELPWDSMEEKFLRKCLLDHASQNPASVCGSLLIVFYLQRYRYMEAYQLDRELQQLEQNFLETANEEAACKVKSINHWRAGLVEKSLELLPEVQRKQTHERIDDPSLSFSDDIHMPEADSTPMLSNPTTFMALSAAPKSPLTFQNTFRPFSSTKSRADGQVNFTGSLSIPQLESVKKAPSVLQHKLLSSLGNSASRINTSVGGISSSNFYDGDPSSSNDITFGQQYESVGASASMSALKMSQRDLKGAAPNVRLNGHLFVKNTVRLNNYGKRAEKFQPDGRDFMDAPLANGFSKDPHLKTSQNALDSPWRNVFPENATINTLSSTNRDSSVEDSNMRIASRWRADESSEDEAEKTVDRHISSGALLTGRRRSRISRR